ncbi:MAG: hypothetical protein AAGA54_33205 [Myxococcota bacterium]
MRRFRAAIVASTLAFGLWLSPGAVQAAGPRDAVADAYITAFEQSNNFEYPAALGTLDTAISNGIAAGLGDDPSLAKMYTMKAGILWAETNNRGQTLQACIDAFRLDYNAKVPIELASPDVTAICDEARASIPRPSDAVVHTVPVGTPNADIEFVAVANATLPLGSSIVMYWRAAGTDGEFAGEEMLNDGEGNWGAFTLPVSKHQGSDIEYFFYAFDPSQQVIVNRGDKRNPLLLKMDENAAVPAGAVGDGGDGDQGDQDEGGEDKPKKKKKSSGKSSLPRVFINLGIGTGLGIARGTAELTYEQYTPGIPGAVYGAPEQACAIERWYAGRTPLAGDQLTFASHLQEIEAFNAVPYTPGDEAARTALASAYDPQYCGRRHPVSTGFALAPFHIAPELGIRVGKRVVVSLFGRFQLVTGSNVETDDTRLGRPESFSTQVKAASPPGFRQRPSFTWAAGAKVKYFFGKDERKFRLFAGGFAGYGQARLRVPMNFSNDRNGNSVPDRGETALHGPVDPTTGLVLPDSCVPVWPYNGGCTPGPDSDAEITLSQSVRNVTAADDERIDTVVIGPAMFGAVFGFNYQIHKNFAFFMELNVGGWVPDTSSLLFDLNLGPAITF